MSTKVIRSFIFGAFGAAVGSPVIIGAAAGFNLFSLIICSDKALGQYRGTGLDSGAEAGQISEQQTVNSENNTVQTATSSPTYDQENSGLDFEPVNEGADDPEDFAKSSLRFDERKRKFVENLRLEFARREAFERETGRRVSWHRMESYLRDLKGEVRKQLEKATNVESDHFIQSLGSDLFVLEKELNRHTDVLLQKLGEKKIFASSFAANSNRPTTIQGLETRINAISNRSVLVDFATKATQAMGPRWYRKN